ncbi:hypothetical protein BH11BAC4_BH11BAC4_05880 [soil metagenome]
MHTQTDIWVGLIVLALFILLLLYLLKLKIYISSQEQEKDNERLAIQLYMLKKQLNPHFLFNSFNTLLNIIDKDKEMAIEYTENLSGFYKQILLAQDREMITVAEDIRIVKYYIYMQQRRFGDFLQVKFDVAEEQLVWAIPSLTLQLLIENILKHNDVSKKNILHISISSAQSFLMVSNNINPRLIPVSSTGIGLANIGQRVMLLTGEDIQVIQNENEFNVIIPIKKYPHANSYPGK